MRIDICKERIQKLQKQAEFIKAQMPNDSCINYKFVQEIKIVVDYIINKYEKAKANGDLYVSNVKKPLNRAKRDLFRLLEDYKREEEKQFKKFLKVLLNLFEENKE